MDRACFDQILVKLCLPMGLHYYQTIRRLYYNYVLFSGPVFRNEYCKQPPVPSTFQLLWLLNLIFFCGAFLICFLTVLCTRGDKKSSWTCAIKSTLCKIDRSLQRHYSFITYLLHIFIDTSVWNDLSFYGKWSVMLL